METEWPDRNDESLDALRRLVGGLSPADLELDVGEGWPVRVVLAHMAYWDRFQTAQLARWDSSGFRLPAWFDSDHLNTAAILDWRAVPAESAKQEVLRAADEANRVWAAAAPSILQAVLASAPRIAMRHLHRTEHIEQICAVLPQR